MCLVKYMEMEEFEWHDEENIDSDELEMPREAATETGTPIMTVEIWNPVCFPIISHSRLVWLCQILFFLVMF